MSFNRLIYDDCACKQRTEDSTTPMQYQLYKGKYENCSKCDTEGGVARDSISYGDLVNIENELRNQNAASSVCPSKKHNPSTANKGIAINEPSICAQRVYACKKEGKGFKDDTVRSCCKN
jgi:hypothetical protein